MEQGLRLCCFENDLVSGGHQGNLAFRWLLFEHFPTHSLIILTPELSERFFTSMLAQPLTFS
jgi:hypothetical protein